MYSTEVGMVTFSKPEQPAKVSLLIIYRLFGIMIEDNWKQNMNAPSPRVVTLLGMAMDDRLEQFRNASFPIDVTVLGILIDVKLLQP